MLIHQINEWDPFVHTGKIIKISGFLIEAVGLKSPIGQLCEIMGEKNAITAEVIGFQSEVTYLMTADELSGIAPDTKIKPLYHFPMIPIGSGLLGRIIDSQGLPLDNLGELTQVEKQTVSFKPINPLSRALIHKPLDVGVKAINGLLTLGQGQRIGLFAGSGVGKSILLGMMTKYCEADIVVISLIGERGREVKEFIEDSVGITALKKSVIIASPADSSPLQRIKAAENATYIAEHFRAQNKRVLLLMDSITRYAHALRELGLALGEPPTAKGYPPSVFTKIPKLIERAGNGVQDHESITGIYTVLAEGDDIHDPIVDCARGILDGHIVLSRELAEQAHYPAIDLEQSISRLMDKVVDKEHLLLAKMFKKALAKYRQNKDYITLGAYHTGSDADMDLILEKKSKMMEFLQQDFHLPFDFASCQKLLAEFACFQALSA